MPHPNNKQNKNTNPIIIRQEYLLTQPCPLEEKQTKTQHKSYPIQSSSQTTGSTIGEKKEFNLLQGKNSTFLEAWEKTSNTVIFFFNGKNRNTAQMNKQTINTEVQINEKEIGKLPEKEFRIMTVKMIKYLENKMEKMQ